MIISNENNDECHNPNVQQLTEFLSRVGLQKNESFVILSQEDELYIQAAGSQLNGYEIEYRERSEEEHYASVRNTIPHAEMVNIFVAYLQNANWKEQIEWLPLIEKQARNKETQQSGMGIGKLLFIMAVLVGLTVWGISIFLKAS